MPRGHRRVSTSGVPGRLGKRIRELREERGLAQAELARRVGTSASHMNKLEAGQKAPTVITLEAISLTLGVELRDLFPIGTQPRKANPPDALWAKIAGDLRDRDRNYLVLVRDMLRVLDQARESGAT